MPALGNMTVGLSLNNPGVDYKDAHGPYMKDAGSVDKIVMWLSPADGGPRNIKPLIYADSAGDPGALIAVGPEIAITVTSAGWYEAPISAPGADAAGLYHIGKHVGTGGQPWHEVYDVNGGGLNRYQYSVDTYSDGPSDPFGAPSGVLDWDVTIYAAYWLPFTADYTRFPKAKLRTAG